MCASCKRDKDCKHRTYLSVCSGDCSEHHKNQRVVGQRVHQQRADRGGLFTLVSCMESQTPVWGLENIAQANLWLLFSTLAAGCCFLSPSFFWPKVSLTKAWNYQLLAFNCILCGMDTCKETQMPLRTSLTNLTVYDETFIVIESLYFGYKNSIL